MKYLKVLCFTTVLSLSISIVPMTFVSAQSLDAVIASNEISHSDEQIEPHLVGEDSRGQLGSEAGSEVNVSSGLEDSRGQLGSEAGSEVNVVGDDSNGQMVVEDSRGSEATMSVVVGEETGGSVSSTGQLDSNGQMDGSGGLSGQGQTTSPISSSPMSAEEFSSLISSSKVTPDTTSRLSTTVTSLIKKAASTITTLLCVFITAFLTVRVLLDLMFIALPFTESIATHLGLSGSEPQSTLGPQSTYNPSNSLPGGNRMSLSPQSPYPQSPQSSSRKFTLVSEEVLRARQSPHPLKTYCHDAVIILTVTPMLLVLTVSGVFNHLGLLFGDVIVSLLNNLGGIL